MSEKFNENALKAGIMMTLSGIFLFANPIVYGIGIGVTTFAARQIIRFEP